MQIYAFSPNNKQIMRIIYKNYGWQVVDGQSEDASPTMNCCIL